MIATIRSYLSKNYLELTWRNITYANQRLKTGPLSLRLTSAVGAVANRHLPAVGPTAPRTVVYCLGAAALV